ncbi:uncharacterized protein PGTG_08138 [Puccinia graminis f. sp. tritici CRL 75-36-700-3]|uniref:Uncharacterized protein n=1 Tax=Puccinia graminis f. sp. tritici (strain CRL 75-36-700-3 / race SCCL) TaxID=418459 RepID=E3KCE1_PUCGT|nr:uncharacterized protein PGTG_08138 [Puccinia graminis f. sp. tritici CRL 75-36-700-3]EFP81889.2 hypothetical protein PGTG_08138 [Puccinia graminis f. sp. tritici CRL 75-36-700-3]
MALASDSAQFLLHRIDLANDGLPSYYPNHPKPIFRKISETQGLSMAVKTLPTHGMKQIILSVYIDRFPSQCLKGMLSLAHVNLTRTHETLQTEENGQKVIRTTYKEHCKGPVFLLTFGVAYCNGSVSLRISWEQSQQICHLTLTLAACNAANYEPLARSAQEHRGLGPAQENPGPAFRIQNKITSQAQPTHPLI